MLMEAADGMILPDTVSENVQVSSDSTLGTSNGGSDNDELPVLDISAREQVSLGDGLMDTTTSPISENVQVSSDSTLGTTNGGSGDDELTYCGLDVSARDEVSLNDDLMDTTSPISENDQVSSDSTLGLTANGGSYNDESPYCGLDISGRDEDSLGDDLKDITIPISENVQVLSETTLGTTNGGSDNDESPYCGLGISSNDEGSLGDDLKDTTTPISENVKVLSETTIGTSNGGSDNDESPNCGLDISAKEENSLGGDFKDTTTYILENVQASSDSTLGRTNGGSVNDESPYCGLDISANDEVSLGDDLKDTTTPISKNVIVSGDSTLGRTNGGSVNDESPYCGLDISANDEVSLGDDLKDTTTPISKNVIVSGDSTLGRTNGGSVNDESPYCGLDISANDEVSLGDDLKDTTTPISKNVIVSGDSTLGTTNGGSDNDESHYCGLVISARDEGSLGDNLKDTTTPIRSHKQSHMNPKWSDTTPHASKKKLQSWFQLPDGNWKLGTILQTSINESLISFPDGKVLKVNSETLVPSNPDILDGVDDLLQLSYLNEPSVLYNLQYRYNQDMIYSKAGPVLVAINPFKKVSLYGNDFIESYKRKSIESPHVYTITDTAMREMIRDEVNQSIIISGESGAGKTETAKIAMQYLAAMGGGSGIEYGILKTNPILEAFGNAKTIRNDNSSRFGKLIEIHFSETGKISGANIQTFLLEKSRVVQCSEGERSYHIFYQLCAGAPSSLREKLNLKNADEFKYLKQSNCYKISGVDDAEQFRVVVEALDAVHVKKEDQDNIFAMLAAVLWLGNVTFTVVDGENHVEPIVDEGLTTVATLIGCNVEKLKLALSTRKMRVVRRNDTIVQKLTLAQAIDTRDALAKSIYSCLFDWLVEQVNKSLAVGKRRTGRFINILDIYGFESFERNSFEQFCINYTNERLQQHFNRHLFKLEQEAYTQDGIDWAKIDFEDNQDCLNLFEKKPLGLQSLLDEESIFPNGTDLSFANKLTQHLSSKPCFRGERGKAFTVCHYAGEVTYDTTGFLEKNRDLLHFDSIELLSSCTCHLPQAFASSMLTQSEKPAVGALHKSGGADSQKLSVMTKLKGQLFQLMQRLENTTSHFIRCIKPNNLQSPGCYDQGLVLQQLKCCGVIEVVRISRSGFPTRMSHQKFARRYGFLLLEHVASQDPLSVSVAILHQFNILSEMYQVGYTKLFFRTGQMGKLEDTRNRTLHGILRVQSCFRGHKARCLLKELRRGVATIQSYIIGEKTRKEYALLLQRHRAAISIQKHVKLRSSSKKFKRLNEASAVIQSVIRGWLVRRCPGDAGLVQFVGGKSNEGEEVVKSSFLAELQMRVLRGEAGLREKEEDSEILRQRLQHLEHRWSEHELKMKSMEEVWQQQMRSLQSSLSFGDSDESESSSSSLLSTCSSSSAGLSVIGRLANEFQQRSRVFEDDVKFLVEVKLGQAEGSLDPDLELRRLKQMFETWKKDYGVRLRETKIILNKLGSGNEESSAADNLRKTWWGRRNSTRFN